MRRVYWDTMVFAYLLEGNPVFGPQTRLAYESALNYGDRLCTSVFTLGELLVLPRKKNDSTAITEIEQFFRGGEVEMLPFTWDTAEQYSKIRADIRVKAADAIHLASAVENGAALFVTNDQEVLRQRIPGLPFVVGLDGKIF
jgi:predicted nucleic acid-binding protein